MKIAKKIHTYKKCGTKQDNEAKQIAECSHKVNNGYYDICHCWKDWEEGQSVKKQSNNLNNPSNQYIIRNNAV